MQFIPSTWAVVGVDGDGDGERIAAHGLATRHDPTAGRRTVADPHGGGRGRGAARGGGRSCPSRRNHRRSDVRDDLDVCRWPRMDRGRTRSDPRGRRRKADERPRARLQRSRVRPRRVRRPRSRDDRPGNPRRHLAIGDGGGLGTCPCSTGGLRRGAAGGRDSRWAGVCHRRRMAGSGCPKGWGCAAEGSGLDIARRGRLDPCPRSGRLRSRRLYRHRRNPRRGRHARRDHDGGGPCRGRSDLQGRQPHGGSDGLGVELPTAHLDVRERHEVDACRSGPSRAPWQRLLHRRSRRSDRRRRRWLE